MSRAPSLKLLEVRSDYDASHRSDSELSQLNGTLWSPERLEAKTADILIHPHELSNGDYFLGGWVRVMVETPRWEMTKKSLIEPPAKKAKKQLTLDRK